MLRIIQNSHADGAKSYYSTADYYVDGQELSGVWRGQGANKLGLTGTIEKSDWEAICDQRHPQSGEPLLQRRKENRTVGYDFNFHVPKSVSLLYAETRDERILGAFRDSVEETMQEMEVEMQTRVRKKGQNEDRQTGNMLYGQFVHFTARPVDGVPDPHLHAHCFVFNTTFDNDEQAWKAGQFRMLKQDSPYFEAIYHSRLSRNLADLGLSIDRTAKGWELEGLTPELIKKFSRRTNEIEDRARELGIDDPEAKSELGAKTRSRKVNNLSLPELQHVWRARMTEAEQASLAKLEERVGGDAQPNDDSAASRAVEYAIGHEFERASVVPERRLLATALRRGVGSARADEVLRHYPTVDIIRAKRAGRNLVTTPQVLSEEREIVAFARDGRGVCSPLGNSSYSVRRDWLNASQQAAVQHILESRDQVMTIRGAAGVGKTSLMQEAVEAIEASGTKVLAFAPSAAASRGVQRSEGFAGADTVARLLLDEKLQSQAKGQLLWIDEAGLLGTRTLRDLFRLADELDSRVLLTGDRYQHGSVERGAALRLLEEEAGIVPASVKEIQRQRGEYKAAVQSLSEGRVAEAFESLDRFGWIREIRDNERYQALASDYVETVENGQTAIVVSPTHAEGRRITTEIRQRLKEQGQLEGEEHEFRTLENAQLTDAEKTDAAHYLPGDVVQFFQNASGHTKGDRMTVGKSPLPIDQSHRYTLFRPSTIHLSQGDVIRITQNGTTIDGKHRLNNGSLFTVKNFDQDGNIRLQNGWTIGKAWGHFTYGYTVTSHASQGRTVDRVLIGQSSSSLAASSREQFYVSVSRGRKQPTIYTDDKQALLDAVTRSDDRVTASELVERQKTRERVRRYEHLFGIRAERPARELVHER